MSITAGQLGRHLVPPPLARSDLSLGVGKLVEFVKGARYRQGREARVLAPKRVDRNADEFVDVADVVGEQDELLEMLGRRSGIVTQPRETEVGARPVEQSERTRLLRPTNPHAVRDLVAEVH